MLFETLWETECRVADRDFATCNEEGIVPFRDPTVTIEVIRNDIGLMPSYAFVYSQCKLFEDFN